MKKVKQFGLQRSGTNFTRALMEQNYHVCVVMNEGGWKHGIKYRGPYKTFVTTKDPYAWLLSAHRRYKNHPAYGVPDELDDFLREGWQRLQGPNNRGMMTKSPITHWSGWHSIWWARGACFVRYEDLLAKPMNAVFALAAKLGLTPRRREFRGVPLTCKPGGKSGKPFTQKNFYVNETYMAVFSPEMLRRVADEIDRAVVAKLGYKIH